MNSNFKKTYPFKDRKKESLRILSKYPKRIPVICQTNSNNIKLSKYKYLIPEYFTIAEFVCVLRKRLLMSSKSALFILINGSIVPKINMTFQEIYYNHKDQDNFLYLDVCKENTFG